MEDWEFRRRAGIDLGRREVTNGSEANSSGVGCLWEDEYVEELPMTFDRRKYTDPPAYLRPGLFIGSVATERDLQCLQSMGITHVLQVGVSLRPRHSKALVYGQVKAPDSRAFDIFHAILESKAFDFIQRGRESGGVLVHCAAGRSRSAAVVVAYLMLRERLSCERAIEDVCQKWWICPNIGFKQQLELFEKLGCNLARWPHPESPGWPKRADSPRLRPSTPKRPHPAPAPALPSPPPAPVPAEVVVKPPPTLPPIRTCSQITDSDVVRTLSPMRDPRPAAVRVAQPAAAAPAAVDRLADSAVVRTLSPMRDPRPAAVRAAQPLRPAVAATAPIIAKPSPASAAPAVAPTMFPTEQNQAAAAVASPTDPKATPPANSVPSQTQYPAQSVPAQASAASPALAARAAAAPAAAGVAPIIIAEPVQPTQPTAHSQPATTPPTQPQLPASAAALPMLKPAPVQEATPSIAPAGVPAMAKGPPVAAVPVPPVFQQAPEVKLSTSAVHSQRLEKLEQREKTTAMKLASSAWLQFADLEVPAPLPPKLELGGFVQPLSPNEMGAMSFPWSMSEPPNRAPSPQPAARPSSSSAKHLSCAQPAREVPPVAAPTTAPPQAPKRTQTPQRSSRSTSRAAEAAAKRRTRSASPARASMFLPANEWQHYRQQDGTWDLRQALKSVGLAADVMASTQWTKRFSFDSEPQPQPQPPPQPPKAAVVRAY